MYIVGQLAIEVPYETETLCRTYCGHMDEVRNVKWSPDGVYIASASQDKTVQVWHAATGEPTLSTVGMLTG